MKKDKGLQKLTVSMKKVNEVLKLEKIFSEDLKGLTNAEVDKVCAILTDQYNSAVGEERDKIVTKFENFVPQSTKNELWEGNHAKITYAISVLIQDYGRMPTKTELAEKAGLSRQTIHKHLKEYALHPLFQEYLEQFQFLSSKILAKVAVYAVQGDMRAAKLYLEFVSGMQMMTGTAPPIQQQNNFIQINGLVLCQDQLKDFRPEQLSLLEKTIKQITSGNTESNPNGHHSPPQSKNFSASL